MRRRLTAGEKAAAARLFGNSLDPDTVWIYRGLPFWPWLAGAVSPNGHIYFPRSGYREDFTQASLAELQWLMHELVHVWQWQNGFCTWLGGLILACRGGYFRRRAYRCPPLNGIGCLSQLNMEQQAEVLSAYFIRLHNGNGANAPLCLQGFCRRPDRRQWLPRYWAGMSK